MKRIINTKQAPAPIGPYNQAIEINGFLFVAGQIPLNPATDLIVNDSIPAETEMVMKNILAILTEAGYSISDVIKTNIYVTDMAYFAQVNEVYASYFKSDFPARETVAVAGLPKNVNVEISVVASKS